MNRQQRSNLIEFQPRAFNAGTVEYINSQWVFFDEETEEAALVDEFIHQEVEVQRNNKWCKGFLLDNGSIQTGNEKITLQDQEMIRIRKQLIYSFERLLDELNDEAFVQFINTLNSLNFSIYDCIYCYNHLTFLDHDKGVSGVNFLILDNEEYICSVQHHFDYFETQNDRFELTLNNGETDRYREDFIRKAQAPWSARQALEGLPMKSLFDFIGRTETSEELGAAARQATRAAQS